MRRRWEAAPDAFAAIPRRDRKACNYDAYVPDPLSDRVFSFEGAVAADVADAEAAIARLNERARALADTEALARVLLRAESVASSRIEGLEIGPRRLLRADAVQRLGENMNDVTAAEVLANVDAMSFASQAIGTGVSITLEHLLDVHRRLLGNTRLKKSAGRVRSEQNWIGGSSYNPCSAAFVPPPPEMVTSLLKDLCSFCNGDTLPAVAQAAIAHAQFETIHPFVDGNGRVGRTLIHMVFRRRGLAARVLPPVSLVLATRSDEYIGGLTATRYTGAAESAAARDGTNAWVGRFAAACRRAVADADAFEEKVRSLQRDWRRRLGSVRSGSAADILEKLPGVPIVSVKSAADLIARSLPAVNSAISRLAGAGILVQLRAGRRHRAFEAVDVIEAFGDLERRLGSPVGDTQIEPPTRRVPYPRRTRA